MRFQLDPFHAHYRPSAWLLWKWKYTEPRMMIILSYIAIYNRDTNEHVSSASVSNVGMSFVMLIIKQHLRLEIAMRKFFNIGYGNYWNLCWAKSLNAAEND